MSKQWKIMAVRIGVPFVAIVVCLLAWYHFSAAVFYGYLAMSTLVLCLYGYGISIRAPMSIGGIFDAFRNVRGLSSKLASYAGEGVSTIQLALSWPSCLMLFFQALRPLLRNMLPGKKISLADEISYVTHVSEGSQYYGSLDAACLTTLWFLLVNAGWLHSWYAPAVLYLFVAAVMARHLASLWITDGVLAAFKRQEGSPLGKFLVVVACDLLTLVLAFSAIQAYRTGAHVGIEALRATSVGLLTLTDTVTKLFKDGASAGTQQLFSLAAAQPLMFAAGLLFWIALLKTAKGGLKQYERVDADYHAIARSLIARGKYQRALDQLAKLKGFSSTSDEIRITPLIALDNMAKAEECARRVLEMDPKINTAIGVDEVYWLLFTKANLLPMGMWINLWREALKQRDISGALLLLVLSRWFEDREQLIAVLDNSSDTRLNLSTAFVLLVFVQNPVEALNSLSDQMPLSVADQVAYRSCHLISSIAAIDTREERQATFDAWLESGSKVYYEQCIQLSSGTYWTQFLSYWMILMVVDMVESVGVTIGPRLLEVREDAGLALSKTDIGAAAARLVLQHQQWVEAAAKS